MRTERKNKHMNILLNGIGGHMGREVEKLCAEGYRGASLAFGVDPRGAESTATVYTSLDEVADVSLVDCIVDFSHHASTDALLSFANDVI